MYNYWRYISKPIATLFGRPENVTTAPARGATSASVSGLERPEPSNHALTMHASSSHTKKYEIKEDEDAVLESMRCPICLDIFTNAATAACGHSFCNECIIKHMSRGVDCPICRSPLNPGHLIPNFQLNNIIEHYQKNKDGNRRRIRLSEVGAHDKHIRTIDDLIKEISYDDIFNIVMPALEERRREEEQKEVEDMVFKAFLNQMKSDQDKQIARIKEQIEVIQKDLADTNARLRGYKRSSNSEAASAAQGNQINAVESAYNRRKRKFQEILDAEPLEDDQQAGTEIQQKRRQIYKRFQELQESYINSSCTGSRNLLADNIYQAVKYSSFRALGTISRADSAASTSIISSIEFDCDNKYFAVASVSKGIQVFDYDTVAETFDTDEDCVENNSSYLNRQPGFIGDERLPRPVHPHWTIMTNHKLSCLVWNTYFKSHLLSSDYNGVISLWDINELNWLNTFSEHASRVWSVDVSAANPTLAASASDDGTVKIWSTSTSKSTMTLRVGVNVCSAKFAPSVANYVAVGAADHLVSYYDLRYPNNPVRTFPGHKRSVSYVRWLNDTEIISASTDSTLRRWDISSSDSTTIYIGHKNEKNFVGLSVSSNWISCGSEDNSVYAYHRDLRSPIANYRFANDSQNSNNNAFSTSSCWKGDSNILLAANSKGVIRALQLDD